MTKYRTTRHGHPIVLALQHRHRSKIEVVVALAEEAGHAFAVWDMFGDGGCERGDYTDDLLEAVIWAHNRAKVAEDRLDGTVKAAMARFMAERRGIPGAYDELQQLVEEGLREVEVSDNHLGDEWAQSYPNLRIVQTGGGCEAWRHPLDDGGHVAITDGEGLTHQPKEPDGEWLVGRYDRDGSPVGDPIELHSVDSVRRVFKMVVGF